MEHVVAAVNRANQRGGRMLSVVDLVEAGTFSPTQAAWLAARVLEGGSWLVGARPGGAGKTTVMAALLALVPRGAVVRLTANEGDWQEARRGEYVVSYELSPGSYDAYIWGEDVRRLARLGGSGRRIVSNLHADTLEEAREQVVGQCGATEEEFRAFGLFLPLALRASRSGAVPVLERILQARDGRWVSIEGDPSPAGSWEPAIAGFLDRCLAQGLREVEKVRAAWLAWLDGQGREAAQAGLPQA